MVGEAGGNGNANVSSMLYEVNPVESSIVVGCTLVLSALAVAAGFLPARRASRIDAMAALRHE